MIGVFFMIPILGMAALAAWIEFRHPGSDTAGH